MSADDNGADAGGGDGGAGNREVAYRLFAAEFDDAERSYSESDEERAPNYVITPTGGRVNRVFAVGVLTEVQPAGEDILRARLADPTGTFVIYAGQYQPDAQTFLERADPPAYVAVTGKARTFQPEDSDVVYTSIRPESLNEVEEATRDRWTVEAARQTLARVGTMATAKTLDAEGEALTAALRDRGVDEGLAAGIPLAESYYGTTPGYLTAVRELAISAAELVAGERDEVEALALSPDEGGDADLDTLAETADMAEPVDSITSSTGTDAGSTASTVTDSEPDGATDATAESGDVSASATETESSEASEPTSEAETETESDTTEVETGTESETAEVGTETETDTTEVEMESDTAEAGTETEADTAEAGTETETETGETETGTPTESDTAEADTGAGDETETAPESTASDATSVEESTTSGPEAETADGSAEDGQPGQAESAELGDFDGDFDLDEEEREEIKSEFGTEFTSGAEVDDPGEADIDAPDPDPGEGETTAETVSEAPATEAEMAEEGSADIDDTESEEAAVDLEDAVMDAMADLDDGDGAERGAVIEQVSDAHDVTPGAVEDAIQEALMNGRCYEPGDGMLKPI